MIRCIHLDDNSIVFVWSQYDGGNIDKEQWLRFPPKPNEAKLNIMGGDLWAFFPSRKTTGKFNDWMHTELIIKTLFTSMTISTSEFLEINYLKIQIEIL